MALSPFSFVYEKFSALNAADPDQQFFALALKNARFALGLTHPNPAVGAVIVKDGKIIAEGYTEPAGGMHAEKMALARAQENAQGATIYVTLEPCSHYGRTPPCTEALIKAGIARVIYGVVDPNPMVAGSGLKALHNAGIDVSLIADANLQRDAKQQIEPFKKYILEHKPYIVVKVASSADYRVALLGQGCKISGPFADKAIHQLRRAVDAVMIGASTVRIDNPRLTARLGEPQHGKQPIRVILSVDLNLDPSAQIFDTKEAPTWVLCGDKALKEKRALLDKRGVLLIDCPLASSGNLDLGAALLLLAKRGLTSILVEPGPRLLKSMVEQKLADEIWWFKAPHELKEQGLKAGFNLASIKENGYALAQECLLGKDQLSVWLS